jgi:hypothetical protein
LACAIIKKIQVKNPCQETDAVGELSRMFIFWGVVLIGVGLFVGLMGKVPGIGRLPGDLYIRKGDLSFYFPIVTCLVLSLILTLVLNLFGRK